MRIWNTTGSLDFDAGFGGEACATTFLGDVCISAGARVRSDGTLCIDFPVAGYQCIDIDG